MLRVPLHLSGFVWSHSRVRRILAWRDFPLVRSLTFWRTNGVTSLPVTPSALREWKHTDDFIQHRSIHVWSLGGCTPCLHYRSLYCFLHLLASCCVLLWDGHRQQQTTSEAQRERAGCKTAGPPLEAAWIHAENILKYRWALQPPLGWRRYTEKKIHFVERRMLENSLTSHKWLHRPPVSPNKKKTNHLGINICYALDWPIGNKICWRN